MFWIFTQKIGEDEPNLTSIFSNGLVKNHQPVFVEGNPPKKIIPFPSYVPTNFGGLVIKDKLNIFHFACCLVRWPQIWFVDEV